MESDESIIKRVTDRLQKARLTSGATQDDVAKLVGISRNHYAQVERGEKNPKLTTFVKILHALRIKSADIIDK